MGLLDEGNGASRLLGFLCFFCFVFKFIILFIFGCIGPLLLHGLSLVAASRSCSSLRCAGFSSCWLLLLQSTGSSCVGFSSCGSWALERRLSSCGAQACSAACGIFLDQGLNHVPCIGRRILNHCTTREALQASVFILSFFIFPLPSGENSFP